MDVWFQARLIVVMIKRQLSKVSVVEKCILSE